MSGLVKNVYKYGKAASTILHITDPQYISSSFGFQYEKTADTIIKMNPELILITGDFVDSDTSYQRSNFGRFLNLLLAAGLKVAMSPGNHDYTDPNRVTQMNTYLSAPSWMTPMEVGHIENMYGTVVLDGITWLILTMEWSPRDVVMSWANSVMSAHPNIPTMLLTHAYLYGDGTRYDWAAKGDSQLYSPHDPWYQTTPLEGIHDGQEIWDGLVKLYPQIRFVFSGHVPGGRAHLRSLHTDGKPCDQFVGDFQEMNMTFGNLWSMMYRLDRINNKVTVNTLNLYDSLTMFGGNYSFSLENLY